MLFLLSRLRKYSLCWAFFSSSEAFLLQYRFSSMATPRYEMPAATGSSPPGRPCCWSSGWAWPSLSDEAEAMWCSSLGPSLRGFQELEPPGCSLGRDLRRTEVWLQSGGWSDVMQSISHLNNIWPSLWGWILESCPWRGVAVDLDADVPPSTKVYTFFFKWSFFHLGCNNNKKRVLKFGSALTWTEGGPSGSQHAVAAYFEGLGEVQVVKDE